MWMLVVVNLMIGGHNVIVPGFASEAACLRTIPGTIEFATTKLKVPADKIYAHCEVRS